MGNLTQIIKDLNKEEVRNTKLFLNRTQRSEARKDVQLFDIIRKSSKDTTDNFLSVKLYGEEDKNTLYRLKNRLINDINKSLTCQYFNTNEANAILYQIALARLFYSKRKVDFAYSYLRKAENKALRIHNYELLDIIYSDYIKISQESASINPIEYIEKRKVNRKHLRSLQEIDDILAVLTFKIKTAQNFSSKDDDILTLLNDTIQEYASDDALQNDPVLRFRIYQAISKILLQNQDFMSLEAYLKETLHAFEKEDLFDKSNHETKLQMHTYLVNCLFKNGSLEEALDHNKLLYTEMEKYNGAHFNQYIFYYYSSQANIYSNLVLTKQSNEDLEKAIEAMKEAARHPVIIGNKMNITFVHLNLMVFYFDLGDFRKASKTLAKSKTLDGFQLLDQAFKLKISVAELLIRFELEDFDYLETLTKSTQKEFAELLANEDFKRDQMMIEIVSKMIYFNDDSEKSSLDAMKLEITNASKENQSNDIINYSIWLSQK